MVNDMKKGIIEAIDDNFIYVVFMDETRAKYKLLNAKENNVVIIDDNNEIIEVKDYDKELFNQINELKKKLKI